MYFTQLWYSENRMQYRRILLRHSLNMIKMDRELTLPWWLLSWCLGSLSHCVLCEGSEAEHPFLVPGGLRWVEGEGGEVMVEWPTGNQRKRSLNILGGELAQWESTRPLIQRSSVRFRAWSHTGVMDYDEACFMQLTPGVVQNFPKAVGV